MPALSSIAALAAVGLAVLFLFHGTKTGLSPLVQWGSVAGLLIAASLIWSIADFFGWLFGVVFENWVAIVVVALAIPILMRGRKAVQETYQELPPAPKRLKKWGRRAFAVVILIIFFVLIFLLLKPALINL